MKLISAVFTFLALAVLVTAPANAQATRTWVSGVGDDANPCSRTAPCKTFAGAISKTAAGGEISVLDPAGFGVVTITKALTISGDGTLAGILSAGTTGIIVNAGVNDRVVIRNVSINGVGTGLNGIRYLAGKSLTLDSVTMSGFTTRGVDVSLTATGSLYAMNTRITNVPTGIRVTTTAGTAFATLDNITLTGLTNGLEGAANSRVTISNSVISDNSSNGIFTSAGTSQINVANCQISYNNVAGINASVSPSAIRVSNSDIFNNTTSFTIAAGATIFSSNNNRIGGNGVSVAPNGVLPVQ